MTTSPPPTPVVSDYLRQIRAWRTAVLELLSSTSGRFASDLDPLSERTREWLERLLADNWPDGLRQWALHSPYNLNPFPARALEGEVTSALDTALEVLRWRAGVEDFLSDIWDVVCEPLLDLDECGAIGAFLRPSSNESLCHLCLTAFTRDELNVARHGCLVLAHVRAKWPPMPGKFVQWSREAEQE